MDLIKMSSGDLFDHTLKVGSNMMVVGPSGSGKSWLCSEIIRRRDELFVPKIERIIYSYQEWQPELFGRMKEYAPEMEFVKGFEWDIPEGNTIPTLLFIDDAMELAVKDKTIEKLFCKWSHHRAIFSVLLAQSMFYPGFQVLARNAKYICLFRFVKDGGFINILGRQLNYGKSCPCIQDAYKSCTNDRPFGYLWIDCSNEQKEDFRYRSSVFPDEDCIIYAKR